GPEYSVPVGEQGIPMRVLSFFVDRSRSGKLVREYWLYGLDKMGTVTVRRETVLAESGPRLLATGRLDVRDRGKGYGSALELIHADLLSREAACRQTPITWVITDVNYTQLQATRRQVFSSQRESRSAVKKARQEHDRWQAIYERFGGKLLRDKYKTRYEVTFDALGDSTPIENLLFCQLARRDVGFFAEETQSTFDATHLENFRLAQQQQLIELLKDFG
nr:hypothetical protein [Candidatus Woesebacteria bacterium]